MHRPTRRHLLLRALSLSALVMLLTGIPATATDAVSAPTVTAPVQVKAGTAVSITLKGTGFATGVTVRSNAYDLAVGTVTRVDSTTLRVPVSSFDGAALGNRGITVRNPDGGTVSCLCVTLTWPYVQPTTTSAPSILLINTDDQRWDSMSQLAKVSARTDWAKMTNSFVHMPECCPSRATLFSGKYVFQHGVTNLREGENLNESTTFVNQLHHAGYQTAMAGKYLNGWPFDRVPYVPPGWDDFRAFYGFNPSAPVDKYGTPLGYPYVNYANIENTVEKLYGDSTAEYSTDRYAADMRTFLRKSDPNRPVFEYFAPVAPHFVALPAKRHANACPNLDLTLPATFNAHDKVSEPSWMSEIVPPRASDMTSQRLETCRTLQAVDDAVASFFTELRAAGRLNNAYVIFTSDNGYAFGEHRLFGKGDLYEDSIRVPLWVRGPDIRGGALSRLTSNVDLAPTIAEMAGLPTSAYSGQSFLDDLKGTNTVPNSSAILLFGCRTHYGAGSFCGGSDDFMGEAWGIRTATYKYIWYAQTGESQLFNEVTDPEELYNLTNDPASASIQRSLATQMRAMIASTSTLRGQLLDAGTGLPIVHAMVHLVRTDGSHPLDVMTDSNGRFAFLPLVPGTYKMRFDTLNLVNPWYGSAPTFGRATVINLPTGVTHITAKVNLP